MIRLGSQPLSSVFQITGGISLTTPISIYNWKIELYHSSGGIKKTWNIGQSNCPIKSLQFELNKKICGAGTLELAFQDFPIHAGDYILVYWKGDLKYRAFVANKPDPKGGKIKLESYTKMFEYHWCGLIFTQLKTVEQIFESTINENDDHTGIKWNAAFIDTGSTETFQPEFYPPVKMKKVFDDYIVKCDDREWGVLPTKIFTVYQMQETVTKNIFTNFEEVEYDADYSQIKATIYNVYRKDATTGNTIFCGTVGGDVIDYPRLLEIEMLIGGERWDIYTVSDVIQTNEEALEIAYADLVAKAVIPKTTQIKNLSLDEYFPVIGEKIKTIDVTELIPRNIISCDTVLNWSGGTLDTTYYLDGLGSIKFDSVSTPQIVYDFGKIEKWNHPQKIGFMLRTSCAGQYLEWSVGKYTGGYSSGAYGAGKYSGDIASATDYLWNETQNIYISTGSVWSWHEFELTDDFRYFGIRFNGTPSVSPCYVWLDGVYLFLYDKSSYEGNVVLAKFKIDSKGNSHCDVTLDAYNLQANDALFRATRKIEQLEAINATS